ncbi:hypothetical protein PybrP1_003030, partial [[Pythium] brassicae (nom. inval.)]
VRAAGKAHPHEADPPLPDDISTICYTSGTTGDPKGAMVTHSNVMFGITMVGDYARLVPSDVHLSYLPLAHIYERNVQTNAIASGASIGFYQGDAAKLMADMAALRPTIFPTVPRVLNRIYDKITQGVAAAGGVKKMLFDQAYAAKKYGLENGGHLTHALWDPLVFNKLKPLIGGNVRLMMNGSAPLSHEVKEFVEIVFGCHVLEGYGLTETAAVLTLSAAFVPIGNHVGIPWAAANRKSGEDVAIETLLASEELKSAILADMEAVAKEFKLFRFERNDLLTPTFKLKRKNAATFFASEIAAMYATAPAF